MNRITFKDISQSKPLIFLVFYLAVVIYQSLFREILDLGPARLDLSLLLLIYVTLTQGTKSGIVFGFGLGLVVDISSPNPAWLGLGALIKSTLGFFIGYMKSSLFVENILAKIFLVFAAALGNDLLRFLFINKFDFSHLDSLFFGTTLLSAGYTTAVAGIIFFLTKNRNYQTSMA